MILKCKMCGGDLVMEEKSSIGTCEYCGSTMTLPSVSDEKLATLFNRANHFRMKSEFDKAAVSYENIIAENDGNAEAFWGLCLCKYGIEYVDDPQTGEKKPTCHRTQFTSILEDSDYKTACEKADSVARKLYEKEAEEIDRIQKQILEISSHEEPFDVFICYKESDDQGERTRDSVLGQELYYALQDEGYNVFFARITLEDKIGEAYEPYIFAALNSSKVMVVIGTKPEYMNAVWVKNEWSRFLNMVSQGQKKMLIPAYRDMDPYDMPEEFVNLQAQDMSRIGFLQDIIRGITKLLSPEEVREYDKEEKGGEGYGGTVPLLKRAFMFLEDGDFDNGDKYCEKVLDLDPENAHAYLGKLMVEMKVHRQEELADCPHPFEDSNNYRKAMRFADQELSETLAGYISFIKERLEQERLKQQEGLYQKAMEILQTANDDENIYQSAVDIFEEITGYKDSEKQIENCLLEIDRIKIKKEKEKEVAKKNNTYDSALEDMNQNVIPSIEKAIGKFTFIHGWKDADDLLEVCQKKLEILYQEEEQKKLADEKRMMQEENALFRKRLMIVSFCIFLFFFSIVLYNYFIFLK